MSERVLQDSAGVEMVPPLSDDLDSLACLLDVALSAVGSGRDERGGPLPLGGPVAIADDVRRALVNQALPATGTDPALVLAQLSRILAAGAADPTHPFCAAHLHCPPLAVGVAADLVAAVLNQSLDSWDQAPAASEFERQVIDSLAHLAGYDPSVAGGVVTSGGTESNLMGLLLARDAAATGQARVFASELAHFSVARNAQLLGMDPQAVVDVPTDRAGRMDPDALEVAMTAALRRGEQPAAVVATAGTTDLGSIDPLVDVATVARRHGAWLHIDAAYGGGALFSSRLQPLLAGLAGADSIALDLHKLGWLPIPAGVFLVHDHTALAPLATRVAYLNPADDENAGIPSLLGRSLRTTRRADAFKIAVCLRALGREGLGALVDRCHELATYAASRVARHRRLQLWATPVLTTVVFSYTARTDSSAVNAVLRRRLLFAGKAVVGRADLNGAVWLKLTLLNPQASKTDIDRLLDAIVAAGEEEDR